MLRPFFCRMYDSMKCCTVPGPSTFTDLPFRSLIELMPLRTATPSPPFDLSISATCTLGMPADIQTMCGSIVVAAALSAPEASAAERGTGGIMRSSTSTPFFLKMSALSASDSGEKPVHPLMPSTTFCARAAGSAAASDAATKKTANDLIATPGKDYSTRMRIVQAPRGTQLSARSWLTEAPLRMLMNNLDPEVAERPEDLVVYGGIGKAARNWDSFDRIVETLRRLNLDESLLVQSGKPVGVFKTHPDAPRVLIANSNLVPRWATWEHFNELDRKGLMMYGQMTAGSWIYIGSQGIVQGTYETFAEAGRQHYAGDWSGKWILSAGLGGMGGAQPLAATMAGASMLVIECDPSRIEMRLKTGYLDKKAANLNEATAILKNTSSPVSVGLQGNAAELLPKILEISRTTQFRPALVTDQTSAHDPEIGYLPEHWSLDKWKALRRTEPEEVALSARESIARHVRAILGFKAMGIPCVDYGNNIRQEARDAGQ